MPEVFAERDGALWGRMKVKGSSLLWALERWGVDGKCIVSAYDLLPPKPPVVVSDEAVEAFAKESGFFLGARPGMRAGLAAAYPIMEKDNPR